MAALTLTIEPDEFLGLSALIELGATADAGHPDASAGAITEADIVGQARTLMRCALADKLAAPTCPGRRPQVPSKSTPPKPRNQPAGCTSLRTTRACGETPRTSSSWPDWSRLSEATPGHGSGPVLRQTAKCGIGSTCCCYRSSSALSRCGFRIGNTSGRAGESSTAHSSWPSPDP